MPKFLCCNIDYQQLLQYCSQVGRQVICNYFDEQVLHSCVLIRMITLQAALLVKGFVIKDLSSRAIKNSKTVK
jgi:hypothetical protein